MNYRKTFIKILMICLIAVFVFDAAAKHTVLNTDDEEQSAVMNHVEPLKLMPVGAAVGIHIQTNGLLVLGTAEVMTVTGEKVHPAKGLLQAGDYILSADEIDITTSDQLQEIINHVENDCLTMKIMRNGQMKNVEITPVKSDVNAYKIGVWVRDDTQGIGTISYVDAGNQFAALGHGITDVDTGSVIDVCGGGLYPANIYAIVKGTVSDPGEMIGHILYGSGQKLGNIEYNTGVGIRGTMYDQSPYIYDESKALPVGYKEELCIGEASMLCQIDGEIKEYAIWISGIDFNDSSKNKDFVIEIRDKELLGRTGGIIQGMSGSPIIQNGKLVGAVTHVLVNDPTRGYGIFIENMLEAAE